VGADLAKAKAACSFATAIRTRLTALMTVINPTDAVANAASTYLLAKVKSGYNSVTAGQVKPVVSELEKINPATGSFIQLEAGAPATSDLTSLESSVANAIAAFSATRDLAASIDRWKIEHRTTTIDPVIRVTSSLDLLLPLVQSLKELENVTKEDDKSDKSGDKSGDKSDKSDKSDDKSDKSDDKSDKSDDKCDKSDAKALAACLTEKTTLASSLAASEKKVKELEDDSGSSKNKSTKTLMIVFVILFALAAVGLVVAVVLLVRAQGKTNEIADDEE
jgi:hypothetical protein